MESKKDIYNLWIQYTTKNEEIYFRYFISGFVQIWEEQLKIDFDNPPQWQSIKNDLGPHLSRLPEELLPAIGKFLIIAKDTNQRQEQLSSKELNETTLLIKCLTVMSRHFDNITTISNYEYISSIVAIAINIIQTSFKGNQKPSTDEINYIKSFCQLIEVIYDPYLTWRNFLVGNLADYKRTSYSTVQLHVELVPFIYDCFQSDNILYMPDIGTNLIHMLGSFISGSQNSLTSNLSPNVVSQSNDSNGCGGGGRRSNNFQNGMRAICPATVSVVVNLLSTWNCNAELRTAALKCYAIMAIVLQRSNPEERQIDLVTICQFYLDAIQNLLKTEHFLPKAIEEKFDLSGDEDVDLDKNVVDINALVAVIDNIEMFLSEKQSKIQLCDYFIEANYFVTLSAILGKVKGWQIDTQSLATSIVRSIYLLSRTSEDIVVNLKSSNNVANLFVGLKSIGKPTSKLLKMCVDLAYDDGKCEIVVADVIVKLVEWLKHMNDDEQIYLSELLYNICTKNINCKSLVLEEQIIKTICKTLEHFSSLNVKCIGDLIRLVEELGKYSISPAELKSLIWLLREEENFDYRKELLQALASISLNTDISMCSSVFNTFLDIQHKSDGISVPDIRKWTTSGSYGFIFHGWLKLDESTAAATNNSNLNDNTHFRRIILSLVTNQGTGYEIFIDNNGKLVVCVLTKKEFLATTVSSPSLTDKEWHLITVGVIPPKRPFSYTQINVFVDGNQRLGATVKFGAFTEPFSYCTIGCMYERIASKSNQLKRYEGEMVSSQQSSDTSTTQSKGMFPSLMEKTFFPQIVSQVPSYFTLPSRNTQSNDPNVKCYPMGMQDSVFGLPTCMRGQLGSVVLAEPMTNIKTLLEAGGNFASLISQDVEQYDLTSKFVFCYSPTSCYDNLCIDLVPGNKYSGYVAGKLCTTMKIQESINSIGGINTLLPILEIIIKSKENTQIFFGNSSPIPNETLPSPNSEGFSDWEVLSSTTYSEWKMIQNPIACFLCLIRYFTRNHQELNQEQLLKCDGIPILCSMLTKCSANLIDVNVLMSVHVLLESAQNQLPAQNTELIETLLTNLIFNFKIWSRSHYQITIGHIQYISIMIKDDRKYYRKKYGIQFCLDTIRQYYATPENLSEKDVKSVRLSLLEMTKYYIQKDINVKEVSAIISYIASVKHEHLIIEILEMLVNNMSNRYCNDQIFLLMHEPQSAELLYSLLADKTYGTDLYESVLKFINCLLHTNRVSKKHKFILRLNDASVSCQSLYPGLISHMMPLELEQELIINLLEQSLLDESEYGYCGALHLIHNLSSSNIGLKLDVAQKLLSRTFNHTNSAYLIAKQIGWQESIARLLIRRQITNSSSGNNNILGKDIHNVPFEENSEFLNQIDLMSFDEKTMELHPHDGNREHNLILNEIQASVTEAANVIEHEIKEMAETVTEKVSGNFSSVYSMIRQTTSDIQDTFESLAMGGGSGNNSTTGSAELKLKSFTSISTQSSNSTSEENLSIKSNPAFSKNVNLNDESMANIDQEEQLVYLVTNVLFTVLWRGVDNNGGDSWKERGQVIACINLLGLNNELFCSHLTLRLRILEMGIQACLIDLAEAGTHDLQHQQNAAQLLRMVYDLVVLDPNEDDVKKCSTKLLDGVLALLDALMVFQQTVNDDWPEMTRLCLGLLLKCSHHPNSDIVAMATAKLHALLQTRTAQDPHELSYLIFSINKALNTAIDIGYPEQYSFLMPVMKALLEKSRTIFSLTTNVPDLPPTSSGPVFFHDFQMYSGSKQWTTFIEKKIKPLHDIYQSEISSTLWEPLNIFWAECYEACKMSSQKRAKQLLESRRKFQQKILIPWRMRQSEEVTRLNSSASLAKTKDSQIERRWKSVKRFLYGPRGAWSYE